jgi:hypothetical protein
MEPTQMRQGEILAVRDEPVRPGGVSDTLSRQSELLDEFYTAVANLRSAIEPILNPMESAQSGTTNNPPEESHGQVADHIRANNGRLAGMLDEVREMTRRVEL